MRVANFFEKTAHDFHSLYKEDNRSIYYFNRVFRHGLFRRVELTLTEFQGSRDFNVLDVGCGSGRNSVLFIKEGAQQVVGIDFAHRMLDLARNYTNLHGVRDKCDFIQGDFLTQEISQKFDFVVALGFFDYIDDPRRALARMVEFANDKVIASFPGWSPIRAPLRKARYSIRNCPVYFYSRRQLEQLCEAVGLREYRLLPAGSSGYVLVGRVSSRATSGQSREPDE
jgi:SAM-dependent methyltransferase